MREMVGESQGNRLRHMGEVDPPASATVVVGESQGCRNVDGVLPRREKTPDPFYCSLFCSTNVNFGSVMMNGRIWTVTAINDEALLLRAIPTPDPPEGFRGCTNLPHFQP